MAGVGIVYLIWFTPGLPSWGWALLGALIFFILAHLRGERAAAGYGILFLSWALGAMAADLTGLQSLKLVGAGLGISAWGELEGIKPATWVGVAVALAGGLVFLWEAALGNWLALVLLGSGLYLALREPRNPRSQKSASIDDEFFKTILQWRNEEARRQKVLNTTIVSDEELACLASLSRHEVADLAGCLNGDEAKARSLWRYIKEHLQ